MQDIIYLALPLGCFALCAAYIRGLDRLSGAEDDLSVGPARAATPADELDEVRS